MRLTAAADATHLWALRREYLLMIHGFANLTHVSEAARLAVAEIGGLIGGMLSRA